MKRIVVLAVAFFMITLSFNLIHDSEATTSSTYVFNNINIDTTWNLSGSPYIIKENITVSKGVNLTIDPDVIIKFDRYRGLNIDGALFARGNKDNIIHFTSNLSSPKNNDWRSIRINDDSSNYKSVFDYCKIDYAVAGIWCDKSSPDINNTVIENIQSHGIMLKNSNAKIRNNTIKNSSHISIEISKSNSLIENNTFSKSTHYIIKNDDSTAVIKNNEMDDSIYGIHNEKSTVIILNNIITNMQYGIYTENSNDVKIKSNYVQDNNYGIYFIETKKIDFSNDIGGSNNFGLYLKNTSFEIYTPVISKSNNEDIFLTENSTLVCYETNSDFNNIYITDISRLIVKNKLNVKVLDKYNNPINKSTVIIRDNDIVFNETTTNQNGETESIFITDRIYYKSGLFENKTTCTVSFEDKYFLDNPRDVDMSYSHTEIFQVGNVIPEITIGSPKYNEKLKGEVIVNGTSFDVNGVVEKVEIKIDDGSWISVNKENNSFKTWNYYWNTSKLSDGYHSINVRAMDNENDYSQIKIIVVIVDNIPSIKPKVSISYPEEGTNVSGTIIIKGTAWDDISVEKVLIKIGDGSWINGVPEFSDLKNWKHEWNTSIYKNGIYKIYVRAIDNELLTSDIDLVNVTIFNDGNRAPIIKINAPVADSDVSKIIEVEGTAQDYDGTINSVQLKIDDSYWDDITITRSSTVNWKYELDTELISNGYHEIEVRSKDNNDEFSNIDKIRIFVINEGNAPPKIIITSHNDGDIVSGIIELKGNLIDPDDKIIEVDYKIDNDFWFRSYIDNKLNWNFSWNTLDYSNGDHIIQLRAYDGNDTSLISIILFVDNGGNLPPSIKITSIGEGDVISGIIGIKGISHDEDGTIEGVEIQIDGQDWTSAVEKESGWKTWFYQFDSTSYTNGEHLITARAYDSEDMASDSLIITINNGGNMPPLVKIISHKTGDKVAGDIKILGASADFEGPVQKVEYQIDMRDWDEVIINPSQFVTFEFIIDTNLLTNEEHNINIRSYDGYLFSRLESLTLSIANYPIPIPPPPIINDTEEPEYNQTDGNVEQPDNGTENEQDSDGEIDDKKDNSKLFDGILFLLIITICFIIISFVLYYKKKQLQKKIHLKTYTVIRKQRKIKK